jgi:hypothetical protein
VRIGTDYGQDGFGSTPGRARGFYIHHSVQRALGPTQPPVQWLLGVKRPGREAGHSTPSSAKVKNGGAVPPLHPVAS